MKRLTVNRILKDLSLINHPNISEAICCKILKQRCDVLFLIKNKTLKMCYTAIKAKDGWKCFQDIPDELKTTRLCKEMIRSNSTVALLYIPQTKELCELAIHYDASSLASIKPEFQTKELVYEAALRDGNNIQYIHDQSLLTTHQYITIISHFNKAYKHIRYLYDDLVEQILDYLYTEEEIIDFLLFIQTQEKINRHYFYPSIYEKIIGKMPSALAFLDENKKTYNICLTAIQYDGNLLKYVPEYLQDHTICIEAIFSTMPFSFKYIASWRLTKPICEEAIKSHPLNIQYIPSNYLDETMCLTAVKANGYCLEYIPENLQTEEVCLLASKTHPSVCELIKDPYLRALVKLSR